MDITPIRAGIVRVTLSGRLDTQGVDRIETRFIATLVPTGQSALVDLSQVEFLASMGIRMLVSAARNLKKAQARLVVFGPQPNVGQVLEAVSLHKIIPVCATEADALAALESSQA